MPHGPRQIATFRPESLLEDNFGWSDLVVRSLVSISIDLRAGIEALQNADGGTYFPHRPSKKQLELETPEDMQALKQSAAFEVFLLVIGAASSRDTADAQVLGCHGSPGLYTAVLIG